MAAWIRSIVLIVWLLNVCDNGVHSFSTKRNNIPSLKSWKQQQQVVVSSSIIRPSSQLRKKKLIGNKSITATTTTTTRQWNHNNNNNVIDNYYNDENAVDIDIDIDIDIVALNQDKTVEEDAVTALSSTALQGENGVISSASDTTISTSSSGGSGSGSGSVPSYKEIVSFLSCTILIWLSEPLLSLVDTTTVGRYGSTLLAAALGPATLLIDNLLYSTYFLSIATTVQMASARANRNYEDMTHTCQSALAMAAVIGTMVMGTVFWQGQTILTWILQSHPSQSLLLAPAHTYCLIRGSVATFSVVSMVAQTICLSVLDTRTPAKAVLLATVLNIALDLLLVPTMGLAGAALATATASLASCLVLFREIQSKLKLWKQKSSLTTTDADADADVDNTKKKTTSIWSFITLAGPISLVIFGKLIGYSSMTLHATKLGTISTLACHNIMLRVFFFFCTFGESISQATQSFLPPFLSSEQAKTKAKTTPPATTPSKPLTNTTNNNKHMVNTEGMPDNTLFMMEESDNKKSVITTILQTCKKRLLRRQQTDQVQMPKSKLLLTRLMVIAICMGIFNTQISYGLVTSLSSFFTRDTVVQVLLHEHVPWLCYAVLAHPIVMALEGSILATGKVFYLVGSYVLSVGALLCSLQYSQQKTLTQVWKSLFYFQIVRMITFFASLQLGKNKTTTTNEEQPC